MSHSETPRVGYVLKRYPRYSETFIVNEILAHEAAGLGVEIFSLCAPTDTYFAEQVARVRAPVTYLPTEGLKAADFWASLEEAGEECDDFGAAVAAARGEEAKVVYQAARLAAAARQKGVGHLHAHFATSATAVARLAARFAGVPYTFTAHAKDIFHDSVRPDDLGRKLRDAAGVVTVSDFNREFLRRNYGAAAAGVVRVYNGLDLAGFPFRDPADRPARVVAVGRLVEKKGFADLIDAVAVLAGRGRAVTCQIIGGGELEADLKAHAGRLGLQSQVEFLGPRPQSEVLAAVEGAAVLAAPCVVGNDGNRDGLPTVLLEAMALGTPCVATPVTGIPELVRDGDTGVLVPERDPPALADALVHLIDDPALRTRLAGRARTLIEAEFDIHRNAARIRGLFFPPRQTMGRWGGEVVGRWGGGVVNNEPTTAQPHRPTTPPPDAAPGRVVLEVG